MQRAANRQPWLPLGELTEQTPIRHMDLEPFLAMTKKRIIPEKHLNNIIEPHWVGVNGCMIGMKNTRPRYELVSTCQTMSIQKSWIRIVTRTLDTNLGYDTRYEAMIRIQDTNTGYFSKLV